MQMKVVPLSSLPRGNLAVSSVVEIGECECTEEEKMRPLGSYGWLWFVRVLGERERWGEVREREGEREEERKKDMI